MAFPNIYTDYPQGTMPVSILDDAVRDTRTYLVDCMKEVSGYPTCSTVKVGTWTKNTRPTNLPQNPSGIFGYNTEDKRLEYYDGSKWVQMDVDNLSRTVSKATKAESANSATTATKATGDEDGKRIKTTYLNVAGGTLSGNIIIEESTPSFVAKMTGITRNVAPSSNVGRTPFLVHDSNGNSLASLYKYVKADTSSEVRLYDYDHQDGTGNYIGVGHDANGNVTTYAPTPADNSNNTSIATTAFVNTVFDKTKDYVVEKSTSSDGYIKFDSGLVMQWGSKPKESRERSRLYRNITIPKSLTSAYSVIISTTPEEVVNDGFFKVEWTGTNKLKQSFVSTSNSNDPSNNSPNWFPKIDYFIIGK